MHFYVTLSKKSQLNRSISNAPPTLLHSCTVRGKVVPLPTLRCVASSEDFGTLSPKWGRVVLRFIHI